jgi:hypothetical protein
MKIYFFFKFNFFYIIKCQKKIQEIGTKLFIIMNTVIKYVLDPVKK